MTRWEIGLLLLVVLLIGAVAQREIRLLQLRTHRAEVGLILTALRLHLDDVERPRAFGPSPRGPGRLGSKAVGWDPEALPGFEPPVPRVRGGYALRLDGTPRLLGWIDADGDGEPAQYVLPLRDGELARQTPGHVY